MTGSQQPKHNLAGRMPIYTGNSYYLIFRILHPILAILFTDYFIYKFNLPKEAIYVGIVLTGIVLIYSFLLLKKMVYVEFNENSVTITYLINKKVKDIPYSKLTKFTCIDGQIGFHFNIFEFRTDDFLNTDKVKLDRIVHNDNFISFIKWLKSKNEKIEFKIIPPDSKLLYEYYKEFGKTKTVK